MLSTTQRSAAVELCRQHSPHLANRVEVLGCKNDLGLAGGSMWAMNYNVMRIMSGMGGLCYAP